MSRNSVRRVLVAAIAGAAAVAALTLVGTGTASAAEPTAAVFTSAAAQPGSAAVVASGVPGEFDVFDASGFDGGFADLSNSTIPDLTPLNLNDKISSAVNNSNTKMCLFTDANFKGQRIEFPPHTQIQQFPVNLDNAVSSVKPC
ncbi:peptidase inhibitor family I36 protein [Pseudonocardia xinjiangensis]|uniref:Peptidase inhibitor family I36 protein n=1 Tax=Pseudonocardia xinjiangensis TaxID=75289 RepID=A0ABX1REW1_9PSEU|nr:peptidase inhibitor family I36 protein [Pseudonocardia xinjiangensis]NMH78321.1 peptidase inhibitor family I36 protein [Pseudonocardia xinjiangensis]